MKAIRSIPVLTLVLALAVACSDEPGGKPVKGANRPAADPAPATTRPDDGLIDDGTLKVADVDGRLRRPLENQGSAGAVLLFISSTCPISNSYAPEVTRIVAEYGGDGPGKFRFYLVHVDNLLKPEDAKTHAEAFGYTCPVLMDTNRELAARVAAKVTPEAFVVAPGGETLYRGRIDDKWVGYMKSRAQPTTRDLRDALDAVRAGRPVAVKETEAKGCPIE